LRHASIQNSARTSAGRASGAQFPAGWSPMENPAVDRQRNVTASRRAGCLRPSTTHRRGSSCRFVGIREAIARPKGVCLAMNSRGDPPRPEGAGAECGNSAPQNQRTGAGDRFRLQNTKPSRLSQSRQNQNLASTEEPKSKGAPRMINVSPVPPPIRAQVCAPVPSLSRCGEAQTSGGDAVALGAGNLRRKVL
jgi:hypothetical protein